MRPGVSSVRVSTLPCSRDTSAALKGPRQILGIRHEIMDFEPDLGLKLAQTKPKISGTAPTNRHTTIPNDSGSISACFDDDPKLVNCEVLDVTQYCFRGGPISVLSR